jgi:hypothetical protein
MKLTEIHSHSTVSSDKWSYINEVNEWMAAAHAGKQSSISSFHIRPDKKVDVAGDIVFNHSFKFNEKKLPFPFGKVKGNFFLTFSDTLETLENFPEDVSKTVSIGECPKITSLEHMTKIIGHSCNFSQTSIKTLEHLPKVINGDLNITNLPELESMDGVPDIVMGDFFCYDVPKLKKFKFPKEIHGVITFITGPLDSRENILAQNYLDVFKIKTLRGINFSYSKEVTKIFNKYYRNGRDIIGCQDELIEAGFEEFARTK